MGLGGPFHLIFTFLFSNLLLFKVLFSASLLALQQVVVRVYHSSLLLVQLIKSETLGCNNV